MNLKFIFRGISLSLFYSLIIASQEYNDCAEIENYLEKLDNKYSSFALYECISDNNGKVS